jgi:hypothetical protein
MDDTIDVLRANPVMAAEALMGAIGMRRVLEPGELKVLVRDLEEAERLPRRITAAWRAFFADDATARPEPLPDGFDWPWLRQRLSVGATETDTVDNVTDIDDVELGALFGALTVRLRDQLAAAAPMRQRPVGTGVEDVEPSDGQLARFRRVWHVVDDPMRAIRDTAAGIITRQQVDAMRTAYPALYSYAVDAAFAALGDRMTGAPRYRIPWHKDVALRRFLGSARWTPDLVLRLQGALREARAQGAESPMPKPLPLRPEAQATPVERITGR